MAARLATYLVVAIVAGTFIAGLIVGAQRDDDSGPVDLIIHNARVYAADDHGTISDAVAIRGNKILKAGGEREIMRYRRPQTTVIDAKGGAVLPGFDDAHVSLIAGGLARDGVQLFGAATLEEIQQRVTAWSAARADAAWITGSGWSYNAFADLPVRAQLDAAVSDRPAQLVSQDGQALWLNSKALEAARITKRTPNPKHGVIVRDRRGEATGLLKGSAMLLAEKALPKPTREDRAKALQVAILEALKRGITSVQDLGAAPGDLDLYDAARDAGTLALRVYAAVPAGRTTPEDFDAIAKRYPDDPLLKTGLATITLDGSVESQSAAMLAPYAPKGSTDGELRMTPAELSKMVAMLDARGWQIAVDAAGDRGARLALDAFGAVAKNAQAVKAPRHRIENVTVVDRGGHAPLRRAWRDRRAVPVARHRRRPPDLVEEHGTRAGGIWLARSQPERGGRAPRVRQRLAETAAGSAGRTAGRRDAPGDSGPRAVDAEVRDQRLDIRRGVGIVRRTPQGHDQARHARRPRHPLDRHFRRAREAQRRGRGDDDLQRQGRLPPRFVARQALAGTFIPWYDCSMKVALSIPDELFDTAESACKRLGVSRSRLYATALAEFLAKHQGRKTTDRLDAVYGREDSRLDSSTRRLQKRSLGTKSW